ncbi:MAG: hypothetical protein ASARMPREDX12_007094 [Alectoria sarmentosa]|nr:MAG: hypothetical protein ASARMPREDX12_007094 [Alectoria sarmentosa]
MDFVNQAAQAYGHQQQRPGSQASGPPHQGQPQGQGYYPPHQPSPQPHRSPGPPQSANNGLPPGWIQEWDAPDNRYFYINQRTGERTFNRPSAPHQGPPSDPNHNLPPGWIAEWDAPDRRWFFVNQKTGERSWNHPGGPSPPAQYTQMNASGQGPMGSTYQQSEVITQAPQPKNHNLAYGAGGAVAGLAAGALLMHEGHKVEEHWDRDKHKFEDDFDGRRHYRDEERRGYGGDGRRGGDTIVENQTFIDDNDRYGGGYRRGDDTVVENETIINDDRYDDYRPRNDTFVENETIVNEDNYDDRRGDDTFVQNETIVDDDRYGGRDDYNNTTIVRDDGYGDDGDRRDEYRDDGFVDDAARWTGDKVQEVEDIPQDIEGAFDEGRDDRQDYDDDRY